MLLGFTPLLNWSNALPTVNPSETLIVKNPLAGDFTPISPGDLRVYGLDFSRRLASGDSLASAVGTTAAYTGTDGNAAQIAQGAPFLIGNVVAQWLGGSPGFQAGVVYRWFVTATTSDGMTLNAYAHLACYAIN